MECTGTNVFVMLLIAIFLYVIVEKGKGNDVLGDIMKRPWWS